MSSPTREPAARALSSAERAALFAAIDRHPHPRARPDEPAHRYRACPFCASPAIWRHYRSGPAGLPYCPKCGWEGPPF
jgi:predicted RNA-binding Zn-ribbon protein involved in translation (DUF1610 family)